MTQLTLTPATSTSLSLSNTLSVDHVVSSDTWLAGRTFPYNGAAFDGLFWIDGFIDQSGTNSPVTYSNLFGGTATKTGAGNIHGHYASISHQGTGEAGIFIGDLTSTAGGNIFGIHTLLVGSVAANMFGAKIELSPSVIQTGKGAVGVWSLNSNDTYQLTEGIRVSGNWQRAFAIYSDAASTDKYFTIEQTGVVHLGLAEAVNLYSAGVNELKTDGQMFAAKGFTTLAKAGIPVDGDVVSGTTGTIVLDDTNKRLYVRTSLGWQYAALT